MTRTPRLALAAVLGAGMLAVSACQPTATGAAAIVGNTRIADSNLSSLLTSALKDRATRDVVTGDRAGFQRQQLGHLVVHQLLLQAARRQGVTVTAGQIDAALSQVVASSGGLAQLQASAAQSGIPASAVRGYVEDNVLSDAIGQKLTAGVPVPQSQLQALYQQGIDTYDQVHVAHILVKDKATADRLLAQVKADPASFASLAARYSTDTQSKSKGGDLGFAGRGSYVKEFSAAAFGARPGTFVEAHTQFGWHVIEVIERRTRTLAQVTPALRRQALTQVAQQRTVAYLTKLSKDLGVRTSPQYGRWDTKTFTVVSANPDYLRPGTKAPSATPAATGGQGG